MGKKGYRVINVTMRDELSGDEVNREIDLSLFAIDGFTMSNPELQRKALLDWIEQRGNAQHNADLTLISWYIG